MQKFKYTGITPDGRRVKGVLFASNQADLKHKLRKQHIHLISGSQQKTNRFTESKSKINRKELIFITFQLAQLLKAGVPLLESIESLKDSVESATCQTMLSELYDRMQGGATFSEALLFHQKVFGKVYLALVAVGENTGKLDTILESLGEMLKWEDELASKAKKVMVYPTIVATVVVSVVVLMMVFVVPELLGFINSMDGEVGLATVALMATSGFIQDYIVELFIVPLIVLFIIQWSRARSKTFKVKTDRWLLKSPIVGPVIYKLKLARVANTLEIMSSSGISFTESMAMCSKVADNAYLASNMNWASKLILEGRSIHEAFEIANVFPKLAISMIKVGESSSQMSGALSNISYFYDREAKELIDKIEPAIEPILTVVMGLIVGWVMLAVLSPIYDTIAQVP